MIENSLKSLFVVFLFFFHVNCAVIKYIQYKDTTENPGWGEEKIVKSYAIHLSLGLFLCQNSLCAMNLKGSI